jgi:hypothetical protein
MSLFNHRFGLMSKAPAAPPTLTYVTNVVDTTNLVTYTFTGVNIGTAAANRYVIVGVASRHQSFSRTIVSASIAGVAAAVIADGDISRSQAAILIALVPAGATGDVVIQFTAVAERAGIVVWTAHGLSSPTPVDFLNTASGTLDIDTAADGIVVAVNLGVSQTPSWSGITEDLPDTVLEGLNEYGAASASMTAAATPRAISRSGLGTVPVTAIASFR